MPSKAITGLKGSPKVSKDFNRYPKDSTGLKGSLRSPEVSIGFKGLRNTLQVSRGQTQLVLHRFTKGLYSSLLVPKDFLSSPLQGTDLFTHLLTMTVCLSYLTLIYVPSLI